MTGPIGLWVRWKNAMGAVFSSPGNPIFLRFQ